MLGACNGQEARLRLLIAGAHGHDGPASLIEADELEVAGASARQESGGGVLI